MKKIKIKTDSKILFQVKDKKGKEIFSIRDSGKKSKIILGSFIFFILVTNSHAGLFGISPKLFEKNTKNIQEKLESMNGDVNKNAVVLKDLIKMNNNIQAQLQTNVQVQAKAFAGLDKSISAGRDVITTKTNDPKIFYWIISGMGTIILSLIGVISAIITKLFDSNCYRKKYEKELDSLREEGKIK